MIIPFIVKDSNMLFLNKNILLRLLYKGKLSLKTCYYYIKINLNLSNWSDNMKGSIVVGKIKGIQIEVNISWLIVFGLVTYVLATNYFPQNYPHFDTNLKWGLASIMALMLFFSVLLHELSHSIVSINLGIEVKKISLFIFGGLAQMEGEPDNPMKELKIAIAGPAMSVFLFFLFTIITSILTLMGAPEVLIVPLSYISTINLVLAIFNLVPAFPLDGGRVLRAIIWHYKGNIQLATKIASSLGGMFGYFLMFLGIFWVFSGAFLNGIWFVFIGWFINQASQSSYQHTVMSDIFNKIPISSFMTDKVVVVDYYISVQELVDSYFYKYKFAIFPVKKNGDIIGIVNINTVKDASKETWHQTTVEQITVPLEDNLIISSDKAVSSAMKKVFGNGIGRILVMDGKELLGIVSKTDILNYIRIHSQLE